MLTRINLAITKIDRRNYMSNKYVGLIRKLVHNTGLSVLEIAVEIKASEKSIYKWMNGTSLPNCEHLLALLALADEHYYWDH